HCAAVTHEDFGGLEIPTEEAGGASENRRGQSRDERLTVEVRDHREEDRSHRGDAGAQAVHVIENAERCGDADDPKYSEDSVECIARASRDESLEYLGVNSAGKKNPGREGHRDEELNLMMQPAFVVEEPDDCD